MYEKKCPIISIQYFSITTIPIAGLHGAFSVVSTPEQVPEMSELEKLFPELELGGRYRPPHCTSRHRVAIIVPFRDREDHLRTFLFNLHTLLPRQQLGKFTRKSCCFNYILETKLSPVFLAHYHSHIICKYFQIMVFMSLSSKETNPLIVQCF